MLNVCLGLNLSRMGKKFQKIRILCNQRKQENRNTTKTKVILNRAVNPKWKIIPYTVTLQLSVKLVTALSTLSAQCRFHDSGNIVSDVALAQSYKMAFG